jgi:hypothetical protein
MSEVSSAKDIYRRFLDGKLALQEAAAVLRAYARSGPAPAAGTLALDAIALEAFTEEERPRVGGLLNEVLGPISRAFASGEVGVEAAARQLAPFIPPHSFFGLDDTAPDGSSWSPEAVARFGELFTRLAELLREPGVGP